tara:strand:+ start:535 stop:981 length:447 start_codon:yes stop_codon:yes gene_type:complete
MKILFVDMDGVIVKSDSALSKISDEIKEEYHGRYYDIPNFFSLMDPNDGAIDAYKKLSSVFDTYILTAAPWNNPTAANDKIEWVKEYLPKEAHKRVIITHHKNLCSGDFLIDDNTRNGAGMFKGEHIHFGTEQFPSWKIVLKYLLEKT